MYDLNPIVYHYPLQNHFSHHEIFIVFVPINKHINRLKSMKKKWIQFIQVITTGTVLCIDFPYWAAVAAFSLCSLQTDVIVVVVDAFNHFPKDTQLNSWHCNQPPLVINRQVDCEKSTLWSCFSSCNAHPITTTTADIVQSCVNEALHGALVLPSSWRISSNVLKRKICTVDAHWLNGQISASKCCCSCRLLCSTSWFVVIYLQVVGPVKVPQSPPIIVFFSKVNFFGTVQISIFVFLLCSNFDKIENICCPIDFNLNHHFRKLI